MPYCFVCKQDKPLKLCTGCANKAYCSEECHMQDWPVHRANCKVLKDRSREHGRIANQPIGELTARIARNEQKVDDEVCAIGHMIDRSKCNCRRKAKARRLLSTIRGTMDKSIIVQHINVGGAEETALVLIEVLELIGETSEAESRKIRLALLKQAVEEGMERRRCSGSL